MKKIIGLSLLTAMMLPFAAQAVEVGDIMYYDKTYSTTIDTSKMPIGVVYWVNTDRTKGYVLSLPQPADMNLATAKSQCANFSTLGTNAGEWKLPTMHQGFTMMTRRWNGTTDNKFTNINAKLATITTGQPLKSSYYWTLSRSNYWAPNPSSGQFYYNTSTSGNRSVRCVMEVSF